MNETLIINQREASLYGETLLGGKARNMAWLSRNDLPVPEWFVISTDAFLLQLKEDDVYQWIGEKLSNVTAENKDINHIAKTIREKIKEKNLNSKISRILEENLKNIPGWENLFFAVRSSAVGEDAADASFAGQMDSYLYQQGFEQISQSIVSCFASAFTDRAIRYRLHKGISITDIRAAVIVQKMIDSSISGVLFTAHPVTGSRKHGLISACYGSGEGVVSGHCNTDEFTIDLINYNIDSTLGEKDCQIVMDHEKGGGTIEKEVPLDLRNKPCLNDNQIKEITRIGTYISKKLSSPQDIEWTYDDNSLYIVQTRPVTSLPAPVEPIGETIVWDNSNIQESYCGVTTPLTFSFASRAYATVYEQTSRLMGIPENKIEEMLPVFRNLLGLIKGRVYYNINNWYKGLLLLPSFQTNKSDMERMMGLQDPVDLVEDHQLTILQKIKKLPMVLRALSRLLSNFKKIDKLVFEFRDMFERVYKSINRAELYTLEMDELLNLSKELDKSLLMNWETPIINDFYVMMMNGKVHRWLDDVGIENPELLQNNLMSGEEGIESTEPTKYILRMCDYIRKNIRLHSLIITSKPENLLDSIQVTETNFYQQCLKYIELYGDRCMGELKLESTTLRQDPTFLFSVIKNYLSREDLTIETLNKNEMKFRMDAEEEVFGKIKKKKGGLKLRKFKKDLKKLRQAVKNRENMRLMRTRMFGLYRDIYKEIGNQLTFYGVLENAHDIFYLNVEEFETYMEGRSVQAQWKELVDCRKKEFASYEDMELPHHFKTKGPVYHHNDYKYDKSISCSL